MPFYRPIIKGGGTDVSDTTAVAGDVLASKDFYLANGTKATGTIPTYSGSVNVTENTTLETGGTYVTDNIVVDVSGGGLPSTSGGSLFTGATIPLTYKDNTHDYENTYEYKSSNYNITITGLDGRATITGNSTKSVSVAFDVTSATSSLKNFTISLSDGTNTYTYNAMHAHYGTTITGVLTFAYKNIMPDGSEGTIGSEYVFISSADLPLFSSDTTVWNSIYSYQVLNTLIGNFSGSIGTGFLQNCYSFNQPLTIPSGVNSIGDYFLQNCYSFNQPLDISGVSSIGNSFLQDCRSFNQPLDISGVSSIGNSFLFNCYSFNQPLYISGVSSIGNNFLYNCNSFNQPLDISGVSSIGTGFLQSCSSFNQPLDISGVASIGDYFLYYCRSFNQPLDISGVSSIGNNFLYNCNSFNQPLDISGVSSIGNYFLYNCYSFNQPLDISGVASIGDYFLQSCYSFNQPLDISGVTSIGNYFLQNCYSFNQPLDISGVNSIGNYFLYNCYSLSTIIYNASVYPTDNNSLSQTTNSKTSASGSGIKVYGTNRTGLMSALPNRTSNPYRKLINGGY